MIIDHKAKYKSALKVIPSRIKVLNARQQWAGRLNCGWPWCGERWGMWAGTARGPNRTRGGVVGTGLCVVGRQSSKRHHCPPPPQPAHLHAIHPPVRLHKPASHQMSSLGILVRDGDALTSFRAINPFTIGRKSSYFMWVMPDEFIQDRVTPYSPKGSCNNCIYLL